MYPSLINHHIYTNYTFMSHLISNAPPQHPQQNHSHKQYFNNLTNPHHHPTIPPNPLPPPCTLYQPLRPVLTHPIPYHPLTHSDLHNISPNTTYIVHTTHLLITSSDHHLPRLLPYYTSPDIPPPPCILLYTHRYIQHFDNNLSPIATSRSLFIINSHHPTHHDDHLYFEDLLIDLTPQILHRTFPYPPTRHYVSFTFTNKLAQ